MDRCRYEAEVSWTGQGTGFALRAENAHKDEPGVDGHCGWGPCGYGCVAGVLHAVGKP